MSESPKPSEGFAAGLKLWLLFLIGFLLLGYPVELSIFLGAIGGLAGGWVIAWWRIEESDKPLEKTTETNLSNVAKGRSISYRKQRQQRASSGLLTAISRWFDKKDSRS